MILHCKQSSLCLHAGFSKVAHLRYLYSIDKNSIGHLFFYDIYIFPIINPKYDDYIRQQYYSTNAGISHTYAHKISAKRKKHSSTDPKAEKSSKMINLKSKMKI